MPPKAASTAACPVCGEPRGDAEARFCEVCRYDFQSRAGGASAPRAAAPVVTPARATPSSAASSGWRIVVTVDPSIDTEPDPATPCPVGTPDVTLDVDRELLVGRRDDRRDIKPDVPLADPGASRRHAKLVLEGTALSLQDLASTNGTTLNGARVEPGSKHSLAAGDEITLGRWTRIRVEPR
jgi:pSer/pThr/pTyr-binding forkhead associated (FHA) protein